ncbi:limonene hydroxylase [Clostridium magnum DSM 2767]|uniref:Limonene hydroxylase n=1 Tax=Clostridium magnum DSM 2767 TaxID=1121326 RepID=A0A162S2Z3_9CLOT|nr:sigma 54-interacting transcriptional regulator [Clostridium magnum]KZL90710.1 limonene hydroxylase [Clostridium magnum DSM 2767]SHI41279.1 regulatory protein, Fis family [Clostridium magnum DSM 2767]
MKNPEEKMYRKLAEKISSGRAIYTFEKIIGKNEGFVNIIEYAKKISDSTSTVLITGESGTGKEVFAQAIHNWSSRRNEAFIAVNCGAIPSNLIEAELLGYEEGAFTGAKKGGNAGKFEMADGGTIFLDEIGEMSLETQVRLLRVIEEGVISRVGGSKQIPVNVRIIAATNKDLKEEVKDGNFRKDLFYRLNVLPICLPPLRDRKEDIPILVDYYMTRISKKLNKKKFQIDKIVMNNFLEYEWPGNIRELENVIELIVNTERIPEDIFNTYKTPQTSKNKTFESPVRFESMKLDDVEKNHIIKVLKSFSGNISLSAKAMGIGRNTLYRKMDKYHIECSELEHCAKMEQKIH